MSPPSQGAWIEISCTMAVEVVTPSPPSQGAWIEMPDQRVLDDDGTGSPPSQGAWIEISTILIKVADSCVAPLAGGVD